MAGRIIQSPARWFRKWAAVRRPQCESNPSNALVIVEPSTPTHSSELGESQTGDVWSRPRFDKACRFGLLTGWRIDD